MKTRTINYASYSRNRNYWHDQQEKGVEIEVTRGGKPMMILFGEPEPCVETSLEKLKRNKLRIN